MSPEVWLFDDEMQFRVAYQRAFRDQRISLRVFGSADELRRAVAAGGRGDVVILDVLAPQGDLSTHTGVRAGIGLWEDLKEKFETEEFEPEFLFLTSLDSRSIQMDAGEGAPKVLAKQVYEPSSVARYVRYSLLAPSWLAGIVEQLHRYESYKEDWDRRGGRPINQWIIASAIKLLRDSSFPSTPEPHVCPTRKGGVAIYWDTPPAETGQTLLLEFVDEDSVRVVRQEGRAPAVDETIEGPSEVTSEALQEYVWSLSGIAGN